MFSFIKRNEKVVLEVKMSISENRSVRLLKTKKEEFDELISHEIGQGFFSETN